MFDNKDTRNLSDVFKELQDMQKVANNSSKNKKQKAKNKNNFAFSSSSKNSTYYRTTDLKLSHIIVGCSILIVGLAVFFPKNTSFTQSYAKEESMEAISEYELNRHRLNIQNIISENSGMDRVKEQVTEEREIEFETQFTNNSMLPKSEEIIKQEGINGKENVTVIKTYENENFIEEIILAKNLLVAPVPKMIDIGTSEFLAKHKIHIGDTMYLVDTANLKEEPNLESTDVAEIKKSLDVKLLEISDEKEEWCKVSFDSLEGYIKTTSLTSPSTTPNIVEKNRIQRILINVNIDMQLNKPSGLTLNDYQKIFTNISSDTNKIFEENYVSFYNAEKKYNINGIFLASIAAHESAWGTSQIASEKKNLFGYGSYDETPYESSFEFTDYSEGIENVAKSLVKYYLNPVGTKIYDGETAAAWYFNGPTLKGVNTRYASDPDWNEKVFTYMQTFYNKLI